MTVRLRFALLYAGAFTVTGLVLTLALLRVGGQLYPAGRSCHGRSGIRLSMGRWE